MNAHSSDPMARGLDTKGLIERAALRLFVEEGIAESSIKKIARAAKVSQGAMYNHYPSKDELAWQLFATNFSAFGHALRQLAGQHHTLEAQLSAMIQYVFERYEEDWLLVTYVFFARHHHLRRVTRKMGNPYLAFRTVISRAVKRGEIPPQDLDVATSMVLGAVIQLIDTRILGRIPGHLPRLAEPAAASCMRLLQG
jgi:AcrR family transcriptional regulator